MTTLYTSNLDSETSGAIATGWTAISGTWQVGTNFPVSGAQTFGSTTNVDAQKSVYTAGSSAQANQAFSVTFAYNGATRSFGCPLVRCNAAGTNGYLTLLDPSTGLLRIYRQTGGAFTQLVQGASGATAGNTYTLEISAVGSALEARIWLTSGSRPSTATLSITDATHTTGTAGLYWVKNAAATQVGGVDNLLWTDAAATASAVTMTGPTTGVVSVASTAFTVGADGPITGTVVVTPSDSGGGGTFTPTTVSISSGSPTGTFTYTPASTGAKTISVTNNGALTNPASITYTATAATATATTLTGPSTGVVSVASTNFTVGANGGITGTVVVTPSDGGGGGTFTPTTVGISSGSPTGTFTYTPGSTGAKTISTTNNGGLTNPAAITYTATASGAIAVDNAAITWSPFNWDTLSVGDFGVTVKSMQTACCGAYLKFSATGTTTISLALDATTLAAFGANTPRLMWSINYGAAQFAQITVGAASLSLATGLTVGTVYSVQVWLLGSVEAQGTRWDVSGVSPTNVLRIQGITIDPGATMSAFPQIRPKKIAFAGDSIVEGVRAAGTTTQPADHARSAAWFVGQGMAAEFGVIGFGAQAWTAAGNGGVPGFTTAWTSHTTGRPRNWAGIDYYFVMHGYNGTPAQSAVSDWITAARAALGPTCWIFVVCAPSGRAASVVTAAVAAYKASNPADTRVALIDFSDRIQITSFNNSVGQATLEAIDGVHPFEWANAEIGAAIVQKAQAAIDTVLPTGFVIDLGGVGLTRTGELVALA